MIIRLYAGDSDFSHNLVDFCIGMDYYINKRCAFTLLDNMFIPAVDEDYLRKCSDQQYDDFRDKQKKAYAKREHLFGSNGHNKWKKSDPEYQEIVDEVKRQWDIYCKDNEIRSFPIDVRIQYSISEKNENGEAVYYFTCTSQCLVM